MKTELYENQEGWSECYIEGRREKGEDNSWRETRKSVKGEGGGCEYGERVERK